MPYSAEISRANPGCILFLIDQSGSMADSFGDLGSKSVEVSTILNRALQELIVRCGREEGVANYFEVGVIGYGDSGSRNALGSLGGDILHPISEINANPLRVESRAQKIADGAGGVIEVETKLPIWVEPVSNRGTPMSGAMGMAGNVLIDWCEAHPSSFPPVVIHLTDGMATDFDPEPVADQIKRVSTDDGEVILMNVHIESGLDNPIWFPESESQISDQYGKQLFRMSSPMVEGLRLNAESNGYAVSDKSRAFMFKANPVDVIQFFDIGTRAANLR